MHRSETFKIFQPNQKLLYFPVEIWDIIFALYPKSLTDYDNALNALRLVNKDFFREMTLLLIYNTQKISIKKSITTEDIKYLPDFLSYFKNLTSLNLTETSISDEDIGNYEGIGGLSILTNLKELNISKCFSITNEGMSYLVHLTNITHLIIDMKQKLPFIGPSSPINDDGIKHLSNLSNLISINLKGCQITDETLFYISPLTNLEKLNLGWCSNITKEGISHLSLLTNITILNVGDCNVREEGTLYLQRLSFLVKLNISDCFITDIGILYLQRLSFLVKLNISDCFITDIGISYLSILTNLTELNASCNSITDVGISYISSLTNLTKLNISSFYYITNTGMPHISNLINLIELDISYCNSITDISCLSSLTNLTKLDITGCNNISSDGRTLLQSYLLNCNIIYQYNLPQEREGRIEVYMMIYNTVPVHMYTNLQILNRFS